MLTVLSIGLFPLWATNIEQSQTKKHVYICNYFIGGFPKVDEDLLLWEEFQ